MSSNHAENYHYVASLTFQVLELFAHLEQEVELIWLKPSTWVKWNFLFMRYGTLCTEAALAYQHLRGDMVPYPQSECFPWALTRNLAPYVFLIGTQSIFIGRVYILYQSDWRVLVALLLLFAAGFGWTVYSLPQILRNISGYTPVCDPLSYTRGTLYYMTAVLSFILDFVMLGLTIRKVAQLSRGPLTDPLLFLLVRDCACAIAVVWATITVAIILTSTNQMFASYILVNTWYMAILSFTATHLILNLRRLTAGSSSGEVPGSTYDLRHADAFTTAVALDLPTLSLGPSSDYSVMGETKRGESTRTSK